VADGWGAATGGPALSLDLPGHGSAPAPPGGSYAPADAALVVDKALRDAGLAVDAGVLVLGHRWGGFAAELLASAGRAAAVVLVDGLGDRWATMDELVVDQNRWLAGVLADPAALAPPPPPPGTDPRLAHGFPTVWERPYTEARRASITVPVLALESPASPTPPAQRDQRVASFGGPASWVAIPDAEPATVLAALEDWPLAAV
jgi:pimeloyl-ACP methyl ester carboxylesterase